MDGIASLLHSGCPFAAFMLPGERSLRISLPDEGLKFDVCLWLKRYSERISISHEVLPTQSGEIERTSTTFSQYIVSVENVIKNCRSRGGKTVMSRTVCGDIQSPGGPDAWQMVAERLFETSDISTLRFVYFTSQTGAWMGATPETLLRFDQEKGLLSTMALAGTRIAKGTEAWDEKNICENRFVVDFIMDALEKNGISPECTQPFTTRLNNIEHLCCCISAQTEALELEKVIDALNPTPALCGSPRGGALGDIESFEKHQRQCYGGLISINDPQKGIINVFVNLRSMRFDPVGTAYCVYGGGGITAQSVPEDEYAETELKMAPLLRLLR